MRGTELTMLLHIAYLYAMQRTPLGSCVDASFIYFLYILLSLSYCLFYYIRTQYSYVRSTHQVCAFCSLLFFRFKINLICGKNCLTLSDIYRVFIECSNIKVIVRLPGVVSGAFKRETINIVSNKDGGRQVKVCISQNNHVLYRLFLLQNIAHAYFVSSHWRISHRGGKLKAIDPLPPYIGHHILKITRKVDSGNIPTHPWSSLVVTKCRCMSITNHQGLKHAAGTKSFRINIFYWSTGVIQSHKVHQAVHEGIYQL